MDLEKAYTILADHQKWRRAESPYDSPYQRFLHSAKELGVAIDFILNHLEKEVENETVN